MADEMDEVEQGEGRGCDDGGLFEEDSEREEGCDREEVAGGAGGRAVGGPARG